MDVTTSSAVRFYALLGHASFVRCSPDGDLEDSNFRYFGFLAFAPVSDASGRASLRLFFPNERGALAPIHELINSGQ